jgi:hypothetical protein
MRSLRPLLVSSSVLGLVGCLETAPSSTGPEVAINVAPLELPGVTEASYTITVEAAGEVVWTRTNVLSSDYGDGKGALSYVGPCDASVPLNRVTIELDSLKAGTLDLAGTFQNPTPVFRDFECLPDQDTFVEFNLTIMRQANQGFFDIAVTFDDIFCSAKLDCLDSDDGPLELLFDGDERAQTVVMAFACTAGLNESTTLYLSDVAIRCAGDAEAYSIDPTAGLGNLTLVDPPAMIFGAAVYRGREDFSDMDKCYWNTAVGLDVENLGASCTLSATGTASGTPFPDNTSPAWTRWPVVTWTGPLTDVEGNLVCGRHALNGGDGVVATTYTAFGPVGRTFARGCDCAIGSCEGVIVAEPECGNGIVEGTEQCDGDANCDLGCTCMNGYPATAGVCGRCGDGQLQSPIEQCDSADVNCMSCQCDNGYPPDGVGGCGFCGDLVVQSISGEQCDGAFPNCQSCTCMGGYESDGDRGCGFCGDLEVQTMAGEECDGELPNCQSCTCMGGYESDGDRGCGFCGDLEVQTMAGEECDGAYPNCQSCTCMGGYEGNGVGGCGFCGDGMIQDMGGEECDDESTNCMGCLCSNGSTPNGAGCTPQMLCGNSMHDAGEQCDDMIGMGCMGCICNPGLVPDGTGGCMNDAFCGDGMQDPGEQCDDMIGMGCTGCICDFGLIPDATGGCMSGSYCGDLMHDPNEECDGSFNCGQNCTCEGGYMADPSGNCGYCGDGTVNGTESCDSTMNCDPSCMCAGGYQADPSGNCGYCGDLTVNGSESCDGGVNCDPSCMCEGGYLANSWGGCESCGDGMLNGTEECDGGFGCDFCQCQPGWTAQGFTDCLADEVHLDVYVQDSFDSPIAFVNVNASAVPGPDFRGQPVDEFGYAGYDLPFGCWVFDVEGYYLTAVNAGGFELQSPFEACFYDAGPYTVVITTTDLP